MPIVIEHRPHPLDRVQGDDPKSTAPEVTCIGYGGNVIDERAWLWMLVTPWAGLFNLLTRSQVVAQALMGGAFGGM